MLPNKSYRNWLIRTRINRYT